MDFRTDRNNNPAAFTTDLARQAGLELGTDYEVGDSFGTHGLLLNTAKLIGDPIALTIRVIDRVGYYTRVGVRRWDYIAIPKFVWDVLDADTRKAVVKFHYQHEGGTALAGLFV